MFLILDNSDCARLGLQGLSRLFAEIRRTPSPLADTAEMSMSNSETVSDIKVGEDDTWAGDWDFRDVADLSVAQIRAFVKGYDHLEKWLRIFAEHGPVLDAELLNQVGVVDEPTGDEKGWQDLTDYSTFQRTVTKRTRTVTGDRKAYFFTWGEWVYDAKGRVISGQYVITPATFRALRRYFGMGA